MDELRALVEGGMPPAEVLEAVLDRTGYLAELAASTDPQDESRVENLAELVGVAREFSERVARRRGRGVHGAGLARRRRRPDPRARATAGSSRS